MPSNIDALIVGGGVTGLWLRSVLKAYQRSVVLIEANALGSGQTIASQGIIHNGAKYAAQADTVDELLHVLNPIAFAWGLHLSGDNSPDLSDVQVVTEESWYWNPGGPLPACLDNWWHAHRPTMPRDVPSPPLLGDIAGGVRRNSEPTISCASLLDVLAGENRRDLLHVPRGHVEWTTTSLGEVTLVTLTHPETDATLQLAPRRIFLTAGAGIAEVREAIGLPGESVMQRRPLRMGLVRGSLPRFCGHWFDERGARLTISSQIDSAGRTVWQLGGRLAEGRDGESAEEFIRRARQEVSAGLLGIDLSGTELSSYRAIRAEPVTPGGTLPTSSEIRVEGNIVTMWPTKLTLVPELMIDVRRWLDAAADRDRPPKITLPDWPQPPIAQPPWETDLNWIDWSP